jgi:AraC-like DNA-binding protein
MFGEDYLTLRLVRLTPSEEWSSQGEGFSFVFSKGGAGKYVAGTVVQRLMPGDILVLNAATGGKLCALDKSDFVFKSFSLVFEHLLPLFASNEIGLLHNFTETFKGAKTYPGSSPLAQECAKLLEAVPAQFNLEHRSHLLRVAASVLSVEFKNVQTLRGGFASAEDNMVRVFEKLSSDELLNLSVGDLAARFSCSRRHLNRLFHDRFGVSVATLRMEMRLLKAASLLRDPEAKVIHVAERCGFNHLGLFNTCFKRRYGSSPGQWRKLMVKENVPMSSGIGVPRVCPLQANGICTWGEQSQTAGLASMGSVARASGDAACISGSETRTSADILPTGDRKIKAGLRP